MDNMQQAMRLWLLDIAKSVKLSYYAGQVGISKSNLSHFLNGNNGSVSYEKLSDLRDIICSDLRQKIA